MFASTYAMGGPWAHHARRCRDDADDWFAAMTGRKGHGGGHGFGPWAMFSGQGPWGSWPGGPRAPWMPGPKGPWRGPKARRGDVRAAILAVLAEEPMNGYQIIQEIAERSGGVWKPSPGSIYPTLQQLEDEGLVQADESAGRRTFELTDDGRLYVASHPDEMAAPWEAMSAAADDGDENGVRPLIGQVAAAMWQILATGSPDQQARAKAALADLKRRLYSILEDDDVDFDPEGGQP